MRAPKRCAGGAVIRIFIVLGLLVAFGAMVVDSVYRVAPGEVVMVSRLAGHQRTVQHPGLHFKLPFVETIRRIEAFPQVTRHITFPSTHTQQGTGRYLTYTKTKLRLTYVATWRVVEPTRYAHAMAGNARRAEARVADIVQSRLRVAVARLRPEQVIALIPGTANPAVPNPLGRDLLERLNPMLRELGIEMAQWQVEQAAPPGG